MTGGSPHIEVAFNINGTPHTVSKSDGDRTLAVYIREVALLRGTKIVCEEGGCGACTVTVKTAADATPISVNSCLVPVLACNGWQITTIEGLGNTADGLGKFQAAIAAGNATQCGYCTPGVIMSVSSMMEKCGDNVSMADVERALVGNLCRCTGYRPIVEAFKPFCTDAPGEFKARLADIEDLCRKKKFCSKSGALCTGVCTEKTGDQSNLAAYKAFGTDSTWIKVATCKQAQALLTSGEDVSIVAGNTAHGVYNGMFEKTKRFVDVSGIEELKEKSFDGKTVTLGAALTITQAQEYLKTLCDKPGFNYLQEMIKHMDCIGNLSIRNIGTLGGNIAIKYTVDDQFSSDLFVMLAGAGAQMEIINLEGKNVNFQMTDESVHRNYKNISLVKKFMLLCLSDNVIYKTFKVATRALNCEAFVSAAFLLEQNNGQITRAECVQDGIYFRKHGQKSTKDNLKNYMDSLKGKNLSDVIKDAKNLEPQNCLPTNMITKFLVSLHQSADAKDLKLNVSKGTQECDTDPSVWPLNQPVIKMEALEQCAGEACFIDDMPAMKGEFHAAPILASVQPGTILEIDASESAIKKLDGVVGIFTHKDIPGINSFTPLDVHMNAENEEIFCSDKVSFNGQMLGIVVATTRAKAMTAAAKIVMKDVGSHSGDVILTIDRAIATGGERVKIGPVKGREDMAKAPNPHKIIEGSMEIGNQFHFSLESQTCLCIPEEGAMKVYSATQWADLVQKVVSRTLSVPANTIQVIVKRLGGGFGSKISRASQVAAACSVAANALKKPVRMVLDLKDNMRLIGGRAALKTQFEAGVDSNGKILYLDSSIYQNCGYVLNDSPLLVKTLKFYFGIGYDSSKFRVTPYECKTDAPSTTWCRAPGATEAIVFLEEVFEKTAAELGLDPLKVRMANLGDVDSPLPRMVQDLKEKCSFDARKTEIAKFNKENKYIKKGLALMPMKYPFILWGNYHAMVSVYHADGTVSVTHGGIEMGQGINTKVAQACASAFGISHEMVKVEPNTTLTAPNSMVTGASIGSDTCSLAISRACAEINTRMQPVREELGKEATWLQVVQEAYKRNINLCYNYMFNPTAETITYDIYVVAAAEVELDVLTGQKKVARVDILEDVGRSLSPLIDVGQIEGAFVMGLGYWMSEGYTYERDTGRLDSVGTWKYKIPGVKDIPEDMRVYFRKDAPNLKGVLQTKATGEPAVAISVVCLYALRYAIAEVWKDKGVTNKHVTMDLPATPENVLTAIYGVKK